MISKKITEQQNPNSMHLDKEDIKGILKIINLEDKGIANAVNRALSSIELFTHVVVESFWNGGRLFYIGAGTSGRLGVLDASECPPTYRTDPEMVQGIIAGGDIALRRSVEGAEDFSPNGAAAITDHGINGNDTVLGISANGNAAYVHGALVEAKKRGASTGLLMCNSSLDKGYIDHIISIKVGPEVITGSTRMKAGTATKMVLNMITTTAMIKLNKTYGNLMVDLTACNEKLWDRGVRIVAQITGLSPDESQFLLQSADGEVKTAVVMEKFNYTAEKARMKLQENKGSLSSILS